jgi:hypothetical protein
MQRFEGSRRSWRWPGAQGRHPRCLRYGLLIAEAHGDKPDLCAAAAKLKAEPDGVPVFLE